ncbi:MAG: phytanoyl-CoA dioxygenase family protein [Candidatus Poribacteria bacterium]|nr:phytanoyl-CoA dioxygenase family protein [Candidatus Poribacteria bacterium]
MKLTQAQIDAFHQNGYLVVENALGPNDLDPLIADFESLIDDVADELYAAGKIEERYEEQPFERRIAWLTKAAGVALQGHVSFPVNLRRAIFDFLHNDNLLDVLEPIIGPEIYCNPTHHVRPKLPEPVMGEEFDNWIQRSPFHQDAAVLLPEADNTLVVTTWIPLVDATEENGTLQVYPGLHRDEIRRHVRCPYGWMIAPDLMPEGEPITIPVKKGSFILIHCRTPHGSGANMSDEVRWSLDLRWHDARKPGGRPLPGIQVRSRAQPETVTRDHQAWIDAWEAAKADKRPRKMYRWEE